MKTFLQICLFFFLLTSLNANSQVGKFIPPSTNIEVSELPDEFQEEFFDETEVQTNNCTSIEGYNRFVTKYNDRFYMNIMKPVSDSYIDLTSEPFRDSINNFFYNLGFPIRFVNSIAQLQLLDATEELAVFTVNTTVGLLGFFQVAQHQFDLQTHNEDFGQTLGYYGAPSGCHVVLPFFGPSNVRDIIGIVANGNFDPTMNNNFALLDDNYQTIGVKVYEKLNNSEKALHEYETLKSNALDLYPYLRDAYEQYRDKQIKE